jgi:hypothetical protein
MKTYQIELRRTSYINIEVEAESADEAEVLAWKEVAQDYYKDDGHWEIDSILIFENFLPIDETRSYGPQGETA